MPPQGEQLDALMVTIPKTPWKPRITLTEEVRELAARGMTDNYDRESEHSIAVDHATQAEASLPQGMEELVLPLDKSSQTSVEGTEASVESNPVEATLVTSAHGSWSDSPVQDLQLEVHLAINSIFTAKRMSKLERQGAIRDFETSLHQHKAEAEAANEEAKVAHSQRDLQARIKCAKVIMKAKLDYRVTVQEARAVQCAELQESEATFAEALREMAAKKSHECASLCRGHTEHMQDLEAQAIQAENRSRQDFLLAHQMLLHQAPNSVKEDLYFSYSLLLGSSSSRLQCTSFSPAPQAKVNPPLAIYIKPEPEQTPPPKTRHPSADAQEDTSGDEDFPPASQEEPTNPKRGKLINWEALMKYSCFDAFSRDSGLVKEARVHYFTMHPWDWTQGNMDDLSDIFRGLAEHAGL